MAGIAGLVYLASSDDDEDDEPPKPKRKFRERRDPFLLFTDNAFTKRFRLSKEGVRRLFHLIEHLLVNGNSKGRHILPMEKLLICLHHLGSSSFQRVTGDILGVTQSAAWTAINKVYDAISTLEPQFLTLPDEIEQAETAARMKEKFK